MSNKEEKPRYTVAFKVESNGVYYDFQANSYILEGDYFNFYAEGEEKVATFRASYVISIVKDTSR